MRQNSLGSQSIGTRLTGPDGTIDRLEADGIDELGFPPVDEVFGDFHDALRVRIEEGLVLGECEAERSDTQQLVSYSRSPLR